MNQEIKLSILVIILIFNQVLFCESARKIRYHKARNVKRKSSARNPFNFNVISDGETGDVFGFISYYRPKNDFDLIRIGEDFRNRNDEYGFGVDDIIPDYIDEDSTPSTTPRINTTRPPPVPKPLNEYCHGNGQFPYDLDCHKYVDCWEGGIGPTLRTCPGDLVFDPQTSPKQCIWSSDPAEKRLCGRTPSTEPSSNSIVVPIHESQQSYASSSNRLTTNNVNEKEELCPSDYSGISSYPYDCKKFVNCWKGRTFVQDCPPGTEFNSKIKNCDFPSKANCKSVKRVANRNADMNNDDVSGTIDGTLSLRMEARKSYSNQDIVHPSPPSGQRVRLRYGGPYSGYLEIFHSDEWGLVCDDDWTREEADIACKQLGFTRGVASTTQGLVNGPVNDGRKMTESVTCNGNERGLEKCNIAYTSQHRDTCQLRSSIVSITCSHDSFAACEGLLDVPWGGKCYSLIRKRSTFEEAQSLCKQEGKELVEINTQMENDLLSELLLSHSLSAGRFSEVWTGGKVKKSAQRSHRLFWDGSKTSIVNRKWWPGWSGGNKSPNFSQHPETIVGIKLGRKFTKVRYNPGRIREEVLTDYYFWSLEQLRANMPLICEGPQKSIGCMCDGQLYQGNANRTVSGAGVPCLPWKNNPFLNNILSPEEMEKLDLDAHDDHFNHCRNPDGDDVPWCIVTGGEFDICDVPECDSSHCQSDNNDDHVHTVCEADEFDCSPGQHSFVNSTLWPKCILSAYLCDGYTDCQNGRDESDCQGQDNLSGFVKHDNKRLDVKYINRWLNMSEEACATQCITSKDFTCRSFNYDKLELLCTLSEDNIGSSGMLENHDIDQSWDYFERIDKQIVCNTNCSNGKCLNEGLLCDGKNDCGDNSDERNCATQPNLSVRIVGVDGSPSHEGRVEIKSFNYTWGGICDDGFNFEEANVICREAGFSLGAQEVFIGSQFGKGSGHIILDELDCKGDELSVLECKFDPWNVTDCNDREWVGVSCRIDGIMECDPVGDWKCNNGQCILAEALCDNFADCADQSDEDVNMCQQPFEVRLVDGHNETSGRLEVRNKGVWGTVCDDGFDQEDAEVVCKMLGFEGRVPKVHQEAAFGEGEGPIWIRNIHCKGTENSLKECKSPEWKPDWVCKHTEDVAIDCQPEITRTFVDNGELQCGVSHVHERPKTPHRRVASGMTSTPGAHPWTASIRLKGVRRTFHHCGAVILSEFYVLTAGHCMEDHPRNVFRIRVGDWDMEVEDIQEQEFEVANVDFHQDYNLEIPLANDIALIRIKASANGRGIMFGNRTIPACLPPENAVYSKNMLCTVAGWGSTAHGKKGEMSFARHLQTARIPYIKTDQCIQDHIYGPRKVGTRMFCAGYLDGGIDTCQGDSGGGLLCDVPGDDSPRKFVMGIVSWGYGCGRPNRPGVYTKISGYRKWIDERMFE